METFPWEGKAILLVDLDAFFASVEQLDHPSWRGKPVIVGGDPNKRGVVSTASYEARKYGVHSAMPSSTAARLCPDAIWTEGNYSRYRELSKKVMKILFDETPHVQQVSIDEAFMDVSPNRTNIEHPVHIARRIQERVEELGISCSIGVGTTKSIAKLASDMDKPRGLTVVLPGSEDNFLRPLPVRALSGIGASTEKKLKEHGIETLGELADADDAHVERLLGKNGKMLQARARGTVMEPVEPNDEIKSVSNEISFARNLSERSDICAAIDTITAKVCRRLRMKGLQGSTLSLKVRYDDLKSRSVQRTLDHPSDEEGEFIPLMHEMLDELWAPGMEVRLVGCAVTSLTDSDMSEQLSLFDEGSESTRAKTREALAHATDAVRQRFGDSAIGFGKEYRTNALTTGSSAKNPADYK